MWDSLSMKDRAKYIALGVSQGVTSIEDIKRTYNEYAEGGNLEDDNYQAPIELEPLEVIDRRPAFGGSSYDFRRHIYDNIAPTTLDSAKLANLIVPGLSDGIGGEDRGYSYGSPESEAAWAFYLGLSNKDARIDKYKYLEGAEYTPSQGTPIGPLMSWVGGRESVLGDYDVIGMLEHPTNSRIQDGDEGTKYGMGNYTMSRGYDDKGLYVSYYDDWDLNLGGSNKGDQFGLIGTRPFTLYDRRYISDAELNRIFDDEGLSEEEREAIISNINSMREAFETKKKYGDGGTITGSETLDNIGEAVLGAVPIVGTAMDAYEFYRNPSWENAGWLALSLGTDIASLFSFGAAKGINAAARGTRAINRATKPIVRAVERGAERLSNSKVAQGIPEPKWLPDEPPKWLLPLELKTLEAETNYLIKDPRQREQREKDKKNK